MTDQPDVLTDDQKFLAEVDEALTKISKWPWILSKRNSVVIADEPLPHLVICDNEAALIDKDFIAQSPDCIHRLREMVRHWHSHYDAAIGNWNECLNQRDDLQAKLDEASKFIMGNCGDNHRDVACSLCDPGGEVVRPDFVCAYHKAEQWIAQATEERLKKEMKL